MATSSRPYATSGRSSRARRAADRAPRAVRDPRPRSSARRGPRAVGRGAGPAAGRELRRRRARHPGRRCAHDAARRRRGVRRFGDLRRRTPHLGPARSSRRPPTSRTPTPWREGLARPRRADARALDIKELRRGGSAPDPRLVVGVKAGVLALQGDFREHARVFADLGASPMEVRVPADLAGVDVLAIPGGESTTISKLAQSAALVEPIIERANAGMPILGTCAGMIVMAERGRGRRAAARTGRRDRPAERLRPPGRLVRGRPRGRRHRASGPGRVHPRAGRGGRRRRRPGARVARGASRRPRAGEPAPRVVPPRARRRDRAPRLPAGKA